MLHSPGHGGSTALFRIRRPWTRLSGRMTGYEYGDISQSLFLPLPNSIWKFRMASIRSILWYHYVSSLWYICVQGLGSRVTILVVMFPFLRPMWWSFRIRHLLWLALVVLHMSVRIESHVGTWHDSSPASSTQSTDQPANITPRRCRCSGMGKAIKKQW